DDALRVGDRQEGAGEGKAIVGEVRHSGPFAAFYTVMAGPVPAIHVLNLSRDLRRGCPRQARTRHGQVRGHAGSSGDACPVRGSTIWLMASRTKNRTPATRSGTAGANPPIAGHSAAR